MAHLHIPDGLLPPALWAPALGLTLVLLVLGARAAQRDAGGLEARRTVAALHAFALTNPETAIVPAHCPEAHVRFVGRSDA